MRILFVALGHLAMSSVAAFHNSASAGGSGSTYVCWTATGGYTDCAWLPRGYHVPGVRHPHCCDVRHDSDRVEFALTRGRIRALAAQGVRVDTMAPGAWAQLQAVCRKHHH
jgi:hypothetical protein